MLALARRRLRLAGLGEAGRREDVRLIIRGRAPAHATDRHRRRPARPTRATGEWTMTHAVSSRLQLFDFIVVGSVHPPGDQPPRFPFCPPVYSRPLARRAQGTDGRVLGVLLIWFPSLNAGTPEQRSQYEIGGDGVSLRWPALDEDLSIAGLMAGVDRESA